MPHTDIVSYNTLLSSYARAGFLPQALSLYSAPLFFPNHITLAALLSAAGPLLRPSLHAHAIRRGLSSNEFVGSSLVEGYAEGGALEDAMRAFREICSLDLVSCNIMIHACARNRSRERAFALFRHMRRSFLIGFDGFTLTALIKTCSEANDLSCGMQLQGCAVKAGFAHETPICNSLLTMYAKCTSSSSSSSSSSSAFKIFGVISEPNAISWTAMIAGLVQHGHYREAIQLYRQMLRSGVTTENHFIFSAVLPVCGHMADLDQGRQIHSRIVKSWFGLDVSVNNALMDMYSKCGSSCEARLVFMAMENRDVVSFTTLITCFGQHGMGREALQVFHQLTQEEGLKPDKITFLGCLSACSHCGLVEEGIHLFRIMVNEHHLEPEMEHFACLVDLLGRAGRLSEAEGFIQKLRVESNPLVWEALLNSCVLHGEMEVGERSAKMILELQPEGYRSHVSLANMYAERGLWEDKGAVRDKLSDSGFNKGAGRSRVV